MKKNYNWSSFRHTELKKYADEFVKNKFIAANCTILNDKGEGRGRFTIKTSREQHIEIFIVSTYSAYSGYVGVPQYNLERDPCEDYYVIFVTFINGTEPILKFMPQIIPAHA